MDKNIAEQLCKNTIFAGLSPKQIEDILPCIVAAVKTYSHEECVLDKGDSVPCLGVVLEGTLSVSGESPGGGKAASIEENQLFGEAAVFASKSRLPHRVIAGEKARVLYLSGDFFLSACQKSCPGKGAHQEVMKNMLRLLSDRAVTLGKKIAYLTAPDLKTKIAMYLCELYELSGSETFFMPLNRDRLAEFFDVARPSLSRELVNLKGMGIIDFFRSSVRILDVPALYEIANKTEL